MALSNLHLSTISGYLERSAVINKCTNPPTSQHISHGEWSCFLLRALIYICLTLLHFSLESSWLTNSLVLNPDYLNAQ
ncbi:hypothetical protein XENTR_v10007994 [Xenopus tropicalis]|nr:hypothetical protein XENTR_v10007994 [Xenopus tropicalis]